MRPSRNGLLILLLLAGSFGPLSAWAGYKARPWKPRSLDSYAARLSSEGVTIAVEAYCADLLAAQVFDKKDMVSRGIMPLAVVVFNDNDFAVEVIGDTIEMLLGDDTHRSLMPGEVVSDLFPAKEGKKIILPNPLPRMPSSELVNADALEDFEIKFFGRQVIAPHEAGGGFLYFRSPGGGKLCDSLKGGRLYIPHISRTDTDTELIFFEIDLEASPASAAPR